MAVQQTTNCHHFGHPEFQIAYDPGIVHVEGDVQSIINWLEESVAAGTRYIEGQTCQFGWMLTQIRLEKNGFLSLWEPDMKQMPFFWTDSVSNTLAHLRLQKDVVESVLSADELSFPSAREAALICTRLGQGEGIFLERLEATGSDSGWFCGCHDENHDHNHNDVAELKWVSLYEAAACYDRRIIPYLALPAGVSIGVKNGVPTVFRNGELLNFKPGSLLAASQNLNTPSDENS